MNLFDVLNHVMYCHTCVSNVFHLQLSIPSSLANSVHMDELQTAAMLANVYLHIVLSFYIRFHSLEFYL